MTLSIAIDIDAQFQPRFSGIHHYLDSLLGGLYALQPDAELTAFAPLAPAVAAVRARERDGLFAWTRSPAARFDVAGAETALRRRIAVGDGSWLDRTARAIDDRIRLRTLPRRYRAATARYDVLHVPSAQCPGYAEARARRIVATVFDLSPRLTAWAHAPASVAQWEVYFQFARARCARVITISEASARDIVEHLGVARGRVSVTPLAARRGACRVEDPEALRAALAPLRLAGRRFVLYAGTLEPRKNLERLLRAFSIATAAPELADVRLVLAGGVWGEHARDLAELGASLKVGERLILTGYVPNATLNALMSACTTFAYVSTFEGFGLPALEAMTCGAPVVASNASSLPEVVGDAGIQVEPEDLEAIADALQTLLSDDGENNRRRAASRARSAQFSWRRTAELTLDAYAASAGGA